MANRNNRKLRIRAKVSGTSEIPRVTIFRSNRHLFLQAIDDAKGVTIAEASDLKSDTALAEKLAKTLVGKKIKKIVFDRAGYQYHGKVKAIAESLRKAGLEF